MNLLQRYSTSVALYSIYCTNRRISLCNHSANNFHPFLTLFFLISLIRRFDGLISANNADISNQFSFAIWFIWRLFTTCSFCACLLESDFFCLYIFHFLFFFGILYTLIPCLSIFFKNSFNSST